MSVFSKLKDWLTGKSSKSSKSTTSSKSTRKSVKRASTVSNYGGGGSRSVRDSYGTSVSRARQNREDEEKRRRQELVRKQQSTTEKLSQISKRTDALSSGKPSATSSVTGMQTSGSGRSRAVAKLAEMSKNATPDPKKAQREKSSKDATKMLASIDDKARSAEKKLNDLDDKVRNKVEQDRKSYNKATGNKYNTEVGTKEERARARQRIKSGEYQSDPNAEKWEVKNHPVAASAARGALSGATFGASELLARTSKNRKESGAEEFYQKNKNKTAETLGEVAGSLASFGGTAALTDKAAAKAVSKLAPRAAEELAGTKLIQKAAVRSATKAAEKGAVKGVSAELIEQIGKNKASKVVNALGNDIVQNLTTGAIYDINKASAEHEVGSPEWWKELGTSAAFNTIVTGGVAGGSMLGGGRRLVREAADTVNMRDAMRRTFARNADNTPKIDMSELLSKKFGKESTDALTPVTRDNPPDYWYHAGDKGKAEWYGNQAGSNRGTGHFGTGTYFAGSPEILEREGYGNRPLWQVDTSRYNTYRPKDRTQAIRVHENLKKLNVESGDIDSFVKRAKLKKEDVPRVIREYDEATTTEDLERIADRLFSRQDREAISEAANDRLKLWQEQGVNPEYDDFDIDDEIGDMLGDLDLADIDFNDIDSVLDAAAERSAARNAGRPVPPPATFEQAYKTELSDTIGKYLTDLEENGNATRNALRELGEDLGATPEQIDEALARTQDTIDKYARNSIFLKEDSASTIFMKQLGYEGVNVTGIEGMDNTEFGSVIYDLRPEDGQLIREGKPRTPEPAKSKPPKAEPTAKAQPEQAPIIKQENAKAEPPQATPETPTANAETPEATAEAPKTETPRSREELIKLARESQTQKESEDLMKEYFNEYGEVDLGDYGQVTKTADGKYKLSMDGVGEVTLTKAEVEKRIKDSTKRAYTEPDVVDSVTDVVHKRRERASFRQRLKKAGESARRMISDSLSAFEDAERALAKSEHRQVDYGAINEVRAYQAKSNRSISNKQLNFLGDKYGGTVKRVGADGVEYEIENGKSLADIFADMDDKTEAAFDAYLTLKHAPARLLQGKPVFDNKVLKDIGNLNNPKVCMAEADKILKEHPEFARKAEEVYQYTQNELKNRVDAGLLKQSVVDDWNKKYPYYVPTGREGFNEIHGISGPIVGAEDIKTATGSGRDINSIRDQLEASTTRNWRDISTNEMFKKYFGDKTANELAKDADGGIERVLNNSINLGQTEKGGSKQYYAEIFNKGKKEKVEIEPRFYEALADLYKNGRLGGVLEPLDTVNEGFSKVAGLWKNLITEWSPIFMVKNGMRDFPEAIINSRQTKEFLASMSQARKDLATGGPFSEALKDAGISQSTFIDLDKAIREGKDNKSLLSRVNEMVEMYPRLCEYMATFKKAGIDITDPDAISKASRELRARAAANAADVTVNFGRSGSVGKMLNKGLVPFFNPSVQGWSKFVRNITERDLKSSEGIKDALSFFLKATALGAGATTANNLLLSDNPNYQQISARDKATNYIIPWPPTSKDTDTFIKIPSSRFAAAYSLPAVNLANDNKMGFLEMVKVMNDQVAPIDPLESTLFSPFIAAKNNKSWYGTPIVPKALEDLPKPEQYDANTSYIGRALGKATENLPKELQISPKKADYIIDAETGVAGDFALPMLTPSRQGGGTGPGKYLAPAANVLKRQFTIDSTTQNDLSSRFYDKLQDANTNSQSARGTKEDKEEYKRLSAYSKEASSINKAITHLQNSDRATKQDDIYGLQKVRNQLMQDAIDGKPVPSQAKTLDAVQKYVGTSYAVENFGSSADKEAMKVYGASKYGNLSEAEMQKAIDNDKDFYKGVRAIGKLEDKLSRSGVNTSTTLAKSVALASVNADDDMFGAYQGTKKSRTETATKMDRARTYLADGGSVDEYVKLEEARRTLGKLSDYDKEAELDDILKQLKSGEISESEYYQKQGEVKYNANISYVGLATSLAQANAPARGYVLYDIKTKNVQKGINLAAMGFTARDYREMAKAVDADGNGYPKKQEIIDYVANSDVEDKATLYDALYYYQGKHNPFGRPTNYSRDDAAEVGRKNGVESISDETGELKLKPDAKSSSGYYRRGYRRRWHRWHSWGGGGSSAKATVPKPKAIKESAFIKGEALTSKKSSSSKKVTPPKLKRVERKIDLPTVRK